MSVVETLGLSRHIGLMEVAQENRGKALDITYPGPMVIPCRARCLVGFIQVRGAKAILQPKQRCGVARNVTALTARFMMPELCCRHALVPTKESFDRFRPVLVLDPMNDDLAVLL